MYIFLIGLGIVVFLFLLAIWAYHKFYVVVESDEAHVRVFMGRGREIFMSRSLDQSSDLKLAKEKVSGSAYWYFDFLMKRQILPLANVKLELDEFTLRAKGEDLKDKGLVPFKCSIVSFLSIVDPALVIEKLEFGGDDFVESVKTMLEPQVQAIARAASMEENLLDIMVNRKSFGDRVKEHTNGSLDEWGLRLTGLEIVDINDAEGSTVIRDYENKEKSKINSESRRVVATRTKEAEMAEAENRQAAENRKTQAEESIQLQKVAKEQRVRVEAQKAKTIIAKEEESANQAKVEATRKLQVGTADVEKQAKVVYAEGEAKSKTQIGEAEAQVIRLKGQGDADAEKSKGLAFAEVNKQTGLAEAEVIKQKGLSEAEAQDKLADAKKKLTDAALPLEKVNAAKEVEIQKARAWADAIKAAKINVNHISGGDKEASIFGVPLGPSTGASFAQAIEAFNAVADDNTKGVLKDAMKVVSKKLNVSE